MKKKGKFPASRLLIPAQNGWKELFWTSIAFIANNPDGLVVSLGCGFDTRYWRVSERPWPYVEIDLPEVIAAPAGLAKRRW